MRYLAIPTPNLERLIVVMKISIVGNYGWVSFTFYRYRYCLLIPVLIETVIDTIYCKKMFQAILLLLNFSKCIKVIQSGAVSYFSRGVLFY